MQDGGIEVFRRGLALTYGLNQRLICMSEAVQVFRMAIAANCGAAAVHLARLYHLGDGVREDKDEAKRLCSKSNEMGVMTGTDTD